MKSELVTGHVYAELSLLEEADLRLTIAARSATAQRLSRNVAPVLSLSSAGVGGDLSWKRLGCLTQMTELEALWRRKTF